MRDKQAQYNRILAEAFAAHKAKEEENKKKQESGSVEEGSEAPATMAETEEAE